MIGTDAPPFSFRNVACLIEQDNILCTPTEENENVNHYVIHSSRKAEYTRHSQRNTEKGRGKSFTHLDTCSKNLAVKKQSLH